MMCGLSSTTMPHSLVKNGKCNVSALTASRTLVLVQATQDNQAPKSLHTKTNILTQTLSSQNKYAPQLSIMREVNCLKGTYSHFKGTTTYSEPQAHVT